MQNCTQITLTGSPIRIVNPSFPVRARSLIITMAAGGSHLGYVLCSDPSVNPVVRSAGNTVTQLAPATASAPGGSFIWDRSADGTPTINIEEWSCDGTAGDVVICSWELP